MTKWVTVVGGAVAISLLELALGIKFPNFLAGVFFKFAVVLWAFRIHDCRHD